MPLRAFFNQMGNPFVAWLLRSPLHGLLSHSLLLLTVRGRKSGNSYTMPVGYERQGDRLTVRSWRERTWWKNLGGGAPVTLWLQGRARTAQADATVDGEKVTIQIQLNQEEGA